MKKFKNDKERIAFLEDYRNEQNGWTLWKSDDVLQRRWWRYGLPDGSSFVVEEQLLTFNWPDTHTAWSTIHWYIMPDWTEAFVFGDCVASRSLALKKIKELEKGINHGS